MNYPLGDICMKNGCGTQSARKYYYASLLSECISRQRDFRMFIVLRARSHLATTTQTFHVVSTTFGMGYMVANVTVHT